MSSPGWLVLSALTFGGAQRRRGSARSAGSPGAVSLDRPPRPHRLGGFSEPRPDHRQSSKRDRIGLRMGDLSNNAMLDPHVVQTVTRGMPMEPPPLTTAGEPARLGATTDRTQSLWLAGLHFRVSKTIDYRDTRQVSARTGCRVWSVWCVVECVSQIPIRPGIGPGLSWTSAAPDVDSFQLEQWCAGGAFDVAGYPGGSAQGLSGAVGLFAPVAADVPTVPVGAGAVSGAGIAVFEATQINDRDGACWFCHCRPEPPAPVTRRGVATVGICISVQVAPSAAISPGSLPGRTDRSVWVHSLSRRTTPRTFTNGRGDRARPDALRRRGGRCG
jgi:hypothetical protein